jgi:cyanate permease
MHGTLAPIAWIVVGYAVVVAGAAVLGLVLKAPRPRWLDQMAWMLEALCVVLGLGAAGSLLQGHRPESMSTHVGYLAALVCIVPVAIGSIREERESWSAGVVAVAALATAVVAVRLMMTR